MENNNAALITGLREAAAYLEAHPAVPAMTIAWLHNTVYDKDDLRTAARAMGSFDKITDDGSFTLRHSCGPLRIEVSIPRDMVCKRTVTWDCPDYESLLADPVAVTADLGAAE